MKMPLAAPKLEDEGTDTFIMEAIRTNYEFISLRAEEWMRSGYRTYSIWGDELLFCWPPSAWDEVKKLQDADVTLFTHFKLGEQIIGRAVLTGGTKDLQAQELVAAEINLISVYLTLKTKFEYVARKLVAQAQLKTEIDMAAQIQQQFLPEQLPGVCGLDLYAHSCAARHVGGDFYDFFFSRNCLIFNVGDISGKGLPAALFMLMARVVLRTAAHALSTSDPKDILVCANENLYNDFTRIGILATIFVGNYDADTRQLTYSNGAHSPIIYYPQGGQARFLEADTPPLGVFPVCTSLNHTIPFEPGDLLVIGTDGLNECLNLQGEMFGNERLLKVVEDLARLPANQLGNKLFEAITLFAEGAHQADDQTLVVIKGVMHEEHKKRKKELIGE